MREIKFRAWNSVDKSDGPDGTMVIGFYVRADGETFWENDDGDMFDSGPLILMQFTGLKDKNGKEIYEGDIVVINEKEKAVITWHVGNMGFVLDTEPGKADGDAKRFSEDSLHDLAVKGFTERVEVIGNLHEHPELLKTN
jgi:uncharacterized phage protein (TIGR01671 family)